MMKLGRTPWRSMAQVVSESNGIGSRASTVATARRNRLCACSSRNPSRGTSSTSTASSSAVSSTTSSARTLVDDNRERPRVRDTTPRPKIHPLHPPPQPVTSSPTLSSLIAEKPTQLLAASTSSSNKAHTASSSSSWRIPSSSSASAPLLSATRSEFSTPSHHFSRPTDMISQLLGTDLNDKTLPPSHHQQQRPQRPYHQHRRYDPNMNPLFSAQDGTYTNGWPAGVMPSYTDIPNASSLPLTRRRRPRPTLRYSSRLQQQEVPGNLFPVAAIHIAQTIDLFPVLSSVFGRNNTSRKQMFGKNSFVVQLTPPSSSATTNLHDHHGDVARYVAIFRFGSVVFINVPPQELMGFVSDIKKHANGPVPAGLERKEHFGVMVVEDHYDNATSLFGSEAEESTVAPDAPIVTGDYCVVKELDMNGVAVISNIMAQTVALDTYNDDVDVLLANFAKINSTVTKTGTMTPADKSFLFKTVAQNNSIFIDMISKIRIKDRSDTAWNLTKYEKIHYGMKEEFEIDYRFQHIEFKLNLIQQNAKFFLEVMHHQKANTLEWTIVVLICIECVLMCIDMSGMGEMVFSSLPTTTWLVGSGSP